MATPATVRRINGAAALSVLWRDGPMTRADLARQLGLTKASVTSITAQLADSGLVQTGESVAPARVGRPGTIVSVRPEGGYFVGIEVGVDRMNLVTLNLAGGIQDRAQVHARFSEQPQDFVIGAIADLYAAALSRLGENAAQVRDVRVAVPGYVREGGHLIDAKILGWSEVPLGKILSGRLQTGVKIENDANASAFAEWYLSPELRARSMYLLLLETGVGGACIMGGELALGSNGLAGEIGHARLFPETRPETGPARGKPLQDLVGKGALLSSLAAKGLHCEEISDVLRLLDEGNRAADDAVRAWASMLTAAIAFIALAYDVDCIVLSGEMAALFHEVEATILSELREILPPGFPVPALRKAIFIEDGGAAGAAALGHAASLRAM